MYEGMPRGGWKKVVWCIGLGGMSHALLERFGNVCRLKRFERHNQSAETIKY